VVDTYYRDGRRFEESSGSEKKGTAIALLRIREGDGAHGFTRDAKNGAATVRGSREGPAERLPGQRQKDVRRREAADRQAPRAVLRGRRMTAISTADIRAYVTQRQQSTEIVRGEHTMARKDGTIRRVPEHRRTTTGVSNGEINRELTILKRMYTLAVQGGKLYARPHIPLLKEDNVRAGFFEPEQFDSVRAHVPAHLRNVATVAYVTGWRTRSEILPLEWRQVDFQAGELRLDAGTTKNGEARTFPMTADLRRALEEQREQADRLKRGGTIPRLVFTKKNGARIGSFRKAWAAGCVAAGCPGRILHDCRRTAVRNLVRASIPERVAMQMTGHKTRSVFERYNVVSPGDLKDAARKLDAAGQG
jgi:integrase